MEMLDVEERGHTPPGLDAKMSGWVVMAFTPSKSHTVKVIWTSAETPSDMAFKKAWELAFELVIWSGCQQKEDSFDCR
jgi:hypothetical protein